MWSPGRQLSPKELVSVTRASVSGAPRIQFDKIRSASRQVESREAAAKNDDDRCLKADDFRLNFPPFRDASCDSLRQPAGYKSTSFDSSFLQQLASIYQLGRPNRSSHSAKHYKRREFRLFSCYLDERSQIGKDE